MAASSGILRRFAGDRRAVSAVEFALCLPFMLLLYLGGIELSQAVSADRKVTLLARTIGDLVSQQRSVTTTDVGNVFDAASAVLYPFPLTNAGGSILSVDLSEFWSAKQSDGTLLTNLEWSCTATAGGLTSPTCTSASTYQMQSSASCGLTKTDGLPQASVPAAEDTTATVKAIVTYSWTPTIAYGVIGPISLSQTIYLRPRLGSHVCWSSS